MRAGRRGDFLGQASLGWEQLNLLPGEASREISLTLGFRDDAPKRDQELVQGTVQLLVEVPVIEVRSERKANRCDLSLIAWKLPFAIILTVAPGN